MIHHQLIRPSLILFDAAGTLITPLESVGLTYSRLAAESGIRSDPETLQTAFITAFRRQPPMICPPGLQASDLARCERHWWHRLVNEVFAGSAGHPGFEGFFAAVFEHYRRPEAWHVYPEVTATLAELRNRQHHLAVVSNFDSRLVDVLEGLRLIDDFNAIHISTRLGAAKPDKAIFEAVLKHHQVQAVDAWHIGDSLREDVEGAEAAGLRPIWLDRNDADSENDVPPRITRISRLDQLLDLFPI